jgi:hypothetical protein
MDSVAMPLPIAYRPADRLWARPSFNCSVTNFAGPTTYGEIEMEHRYEYHENGVLRRATVTDVDEEVTVLSFDSEGRALNE